MVSRSGLLSVAFGVFCVSLAAQSREAAPSAPQASVKLQPGETAVPGECLTKEELDLNRRLLALTRPTRGVESEQNADDPPRFNPQYFVGTWNIEGVLPESPLGAAGEITGVETVRHVRSCTYESTLEAKAPGGAFTVKSLITYDRTARSLVVVEQDSRGFQVRKTGPVGGDAGGYFSHHWQGAAFTYKGTRVRLQGISFFASPGNYRVRMQMAVDDQPFAAYGTLWRTRAGTTR
jgi:hypothetical protein